MASSFGLIAKFLHHITDSQFFSRGDQEQADGALTHVAVSSTPVVKATANRRFEMPPSSTAVSSQHADEDTGCFLPTPPRNKDKKVTF